MDYNVIYTLSGPDGSVRFVGTTTTGLWKRVARYKSAVAAGGKSPIIEWIREVGYENIVPQVVEVVTSPDDLKARGAHWIDVFRNGGHDLLNVSPEAFAAKIREALSDPEIRAKISKAKTGVLKSAETRAKMSATKRRVGISEEGRKRISEVHTGKVVGESTRKLISDKAKGHLRNLGKTHSEAARTKMSHTKHLRGHVDSDLIKAGCKWCEGLTWDQAQGELDV